MMFPFATHTHTVAFPRLSVFSFLFFVRPPCLFLLIVTRCVRNISQSSSPSRSRNRSSCVTFTVIVPQSSSPGDHHRHAATTRIALNPAPPFDYANQSIFTVGLIVMMVTINMLPWSLLSDATQLVTLETVQRWCRPSGHPAGVGPVLLRRSGESGVAQNTLCGAMQEAIYFSIGPCLSETTQTPERSDSTPVQLPRFTENSHKLPT